MGTEYWKPEPLDTVFLFGTGICVGSWDPVRQAILDVDPTARVETSGHADANEIRAASEAANFWFADLVHRRRRFESILRLTPEQLEQRGHKRTQSEFDAFHSKVRGISDHLANIDKDLKDALVKRLRRAVETEALKVRPQFWRVMDDDRFEGSAWFLTTNWDMALERITEKEWPEVLKVDHIHGSTGRPERLLLPSEVSEELYRSWEQREDMIHSVLPFVPLSWAKQVCLYGLSLSPTDAELGQTLAMGFDDHKVEPGTVVIVNRGDQLDGISRRIRRLCGDAWKIDCIDVDSVGP